MIALILNTETTGLPLWKEPPDHPDQPHVVDLACQLWDDDVQIDSLNIIVNPGVPIPDDVAAIHGITTEIAEADGVSKDEAVAKFHEMVRRAEILVGHNISFDVRMMSIETARVTGEKWDNPLPTFCTMRKAANLCQIVKPKARFATDWKWPKLGEAIKFFFDEETPDAHRAQPDCTAARRIYFELLARAKADA